MTGKAVPGADPKKLQRSEEEASADYFKRDPEGALSKRLGRSIDQVYQGALNGGNRAIEKPP